MGNAQQRPLSEGSERYTLVYSLRDVQLAKAGRKSSDWAARYATLAADRTELLLYRERDGNKELRWRIALDPATTHVRPMIGKYELHEFCIGLESSSPHSKLQCVLAFTSKKMYLRWVRALLDVQHRINTSNAHGFSMLNGSKYYGGHEGVCRVGLGSLTNPSGSVMYGSWADDAMTKHARVEYSPTLLYDGCVEKGEPHGFGRLSSNNQVAVGQWGRSHAAQDMPIAVDAGTGRYYGFGESASVVRDQRIAPTAGMWTFAVSTGSRTARAPQEEEEDEDEEQKKEQEEQAEASETRRSEPVNLRIVADARRMADVHSLVHGTLHVRGDAGLRFSAYVGPLVHGLPHGLGWARLSDGLRGDSVQIPFASMADIPPLAPQITAELRRAPNVVLARFRHGQLVPHATFFLAALRMAYGDEARLQAITDWIESALAVMQAAPVCIKCRQASAGVLFDCGHCLLCWSCASEDSECPVCQQQTVSMLRTFYS